MPWRGVPHTGHASAFNLISAPQHAQKAAISFALHNCFVCWMSAATARIQDVLTSSAGQGCFGFTVKSFRSMASPITL
jgi:hypothetical protein